MYVCDHVKASVSGLFKNPSCPVDFGFLSIKIFIHKQTASNAAEAFKW